MKPIEDSKILIVGLVRDVASTIANEVTLINRAFLNFKDTRWLVIESDSSDHTIQELKRVSVENGNFNFLTLGRLSSSLPKRTERLAYCRNRYLKEIRENLKYSDLDYVAVVDLDNMSNLLTGVAIRSCWERDDWDVCAANQVGPYYDIWALRHPIWSPNDCWEQCRFLEYFGVPHEQAKQSAVYAKQITIPLAIGWIEVDSAFGGLAIYKRSALNNGQYFGLGSVGEEICEHLFLHKTIKENGGRIFINAKLINTGFTEHTQRLNNTKLLYL